MTDPSPTDPEDRLVDSPDADRMQTAASSSEPVAYVGTYRLLQKVGEGGMGEVWLAEQSEPIRRRVALKIIKRGMDTKQVVARFEAERQALALMDHPSIAKVFDAGETPDGRPYFVMEYVPGVPITEHCDRQRLSTDERLALFVQVCEGVQHAHQKAIIHRDLKPSNVLVAMQDGKAVPKIIDFGVAKAIAQRLTEKTMFTELGVLIGTPEYMSPEQAEMTGQGVDTRTDVYALGVILYELLVGALPFDPKELRSAGYDGIVRKIRTVEPPKPSARLSTLGEQSVESAKSRRMDLRTLQRELRGDLDWIAMKALEKDRVRRYGSPAELAADVVRHTRHEPVLARAPSTAYRARKFVRRHRFGVAVAAMGLAVLIGFAVTMAVQARRIAAEREVSEQVSEFLGNMMANLKPQDLGAELWKDLHERVTEARRARGMSQEQIDAALTSLDEALAGVNVTDAALRLLDKQILTPAGLAIEQDPGLDPRVAGRLEHTLSSTYMDLGLFVPMEQHAKRAVAIRERAFGKDNPDTLSSMNALGVAWASQGREVEAGKLWEETLGIQRRLFPEAPDTLKTMGNVAYLLARSGEYAKAEALYEEALELQRRVLGPDHRDLWKTMANLAGLYSMQGRFAEAERLLKEVHEARRRVMGPEHQDTLACAGSLAFVYLRMGRNAEAERLGAEVVQIGSRVLGREHRQTLNSMSNLAQVYELEGRYADAEALYGEVLELQRRVLGEEHPDTISTVESISGLYVHLGRLDEARSRSAEVLELRRRVQGPDHADTLNAMLNLAQMNGYQRRFAEAEKLGVETLEIQRRVLGSDNTDTLQTMQFLARIYITQDRDAEAEKLLAETLEIRRRMLGPEQPDTLATSVYLGVAYGGQGRFAEAEKLLTETLETCRRALGPDHWVTFETMYQLACLAALEGDREKALDWLTRAVNEGWWDMERVARDEDLESLRGDPAFEAFLARTKPAKPN